ncbi:MAG: abortive infection system antitoxin AbiGi family protein [Methanomassiliicoccales archaeon]
MDANTIASVRWKRSDLSNLLVHLTKQHEHDGKTMSARDSLISILTPDEDGLCELRGGINGFYSRGRLKDDSRLKSVCFTEAPLDQIKHFSNPMPRKVACGHEYSPYGLVFKQDVIRGWGGNPCFYVNTMGKDNVLRNALSEFSKAQVNTGVPQQLKEQLMKVMIFINTFGPTAKGQITDFYWEREWRIPGSLSFYYDNIFCGLASIEDVDYFAGNYPHVPFVCPDWNIDKIIETLREWRPPQQEPMRETQQCRNCGNYV